MLDQGLGKILSTLQVVEHGQDHAFEERRGRLFGDDRQRTGHRDAGADEGGQLAREEDEVLAGDLVEGREVVRHRLLRRRRAELDDLEAFEPERLLGGRGAGRLDPSLPFLPALGVGLVGVARQDSPR